MHYTRLAIFIISLLIIAVHGRTLTAEAETAVSYNYIPPFLTNSAAPLVMLAMGRDHTLFYEAYNDASDINGDGVLDTKYDPSIDYYGYFDSYKYYKYDSTNNYFYPVGYTSDKKVPSNNEWSGDFLNYLTMSRLDVMRKVLYGGFRRIDSATETILERAHIPNDGHCWGKEYNGINADNYDIREYSPLSLPTSGSRHLFATGSTTTYSATDNNSLLRIKLNSSEKITKWVSNESGQGLLGDSVIGGLPIDTYRIRVKVGVFTLPDLKSEKLYANSNGDQVYKPIGILQRYGETGKMHFGLLTGSYQNHLSGGVLRKNIGPFNDEINPGTGQFKYKSDATVNGIVKTVDNFNLIGFNHGTNYWDSTIYSRPINQGENPMWGNPIGEMMYEVLRYYSGNTATSAFTTGLSNNNDRGLTLPLEAWKDPYKPISEGGIGLPTCAKPFLLVLSDINPSYDTDQIPGTSFSASFSDSLTVNGTAFDATNLTNLISTAEGIFGNYFIGQSGSLSDNACTEKSITSLGGVRGLCPEEPTKLGGYYSAAAALFGKKFDLNAVNGTQSLTTYAVALASPLPKIEIPMGDNKQITIVPFAKTVQSTTGGGVSPNYGSFQPTCAIVDFYVDSINSTNGKFVVSFEHAEQGSDFDMDGLVQYEFEKISNTDIALTITNINQVQGGGSRQHFGYIISGTTKDGVYLDIKNKFHTTGDPDYYLDTPPTGLWNDNAPLPDSSYRTFTASSIGAGLLQDPLWYSAKWGGFEDINNNGKPEGAEWDKDGDGVPDTYFYVANPGRLEAQLNKAFADILSRTSSGTAASVISQSRSGEGAVYQSIFYPEYPSATGVTTLRWAGQVQSLFVDSRGNIREDSNNNQKLDLIDDKIIIFDSEKIFTIIDDGDSKVSDLEFNSKAPVLQTELKYIWTSTTWLNNIADSSVVVQRSFYNSTSPYRYIITFADQNQNMIVDHDVDEQQSFAWPSTEPTSGLVGTGTNYYEYLTLYPSFDDTPSSLDILRSNYPTAFKNVLNKLAERQVQFIRGKDLSEETVDSYSLNATRTRSYLDGTITKTWRLGDIVFSTPTVVGRPAENYHLLYGDRTYESFLAKYKNRRQVVYTGANDGMLHAFNGGFYNSTQKGFVKQLGNEIDFELGQELWAYVPYNLLPHLYWLTEQNYGNQLHVSYMDLKPKVFDARVFLKDDGTPLNNSTHPDGWGTILVAGMRLGGGAIRVDTDKTDGNNFDSGTDRTASSAYVIVDITNPEDPYGPKVLAEINMPKLGFTTCYPTVMPMTAADTTNAQNNKWYLVFGSGPADATGKANPGNISPALSDQSGQLYVLDLNTLISQKKIVTLDGSTSTKQFKDGAHTFFTTENASFIGDIITVDLDIGSANKTAQFKADAVYYGTIADDEENGSGIMRRLITSNTLPDSSGVVNWNGGKILLDAQQPITAPASVAVDDQNRLWVYFGTGRFFNRTDIPQNGIMDFYGVREPIHNATGSLTWDPVSVSDLYNSTEITLTNGTCVDGNYDASCVGVLKNGSPLNGNWFTLVSEVNAKDGWHYSMPNKWERVLGQAAVLGGVTLFTSYTPSQDTCEFEGTSDLWALYYKTGTPFYKPILKGGANVFATSVSLGKGLAVTPNIHIGESGTSRAFIQTSTGAIETVEIVNPLNFKSGTIFWRQNAN